MPATSLSTIPLSLSVTLGTEVRSNDLKVDVPDEAQGGEAVRPKAASCLEVPDQAGLSCLFSPEAPSSAWLSSPLLLGARRPCHSV